MDDNVDDASGVIQFGLSPSSPLLPLQLNPFMNVFQPKAKAQVISPLVLPPLE